MHAHRVLVGRQTMLDQVFAIAVEDRSHLPGDSFEILREHLFLRHRPQVLRRDHRRRVHGKRPELVGAGEVTRSQRMKNPHPAGTDWFRTVIERGQLDDGVVKRRRGHDAFLDPPGQALRIVTAELDRQSRLHAVDHAPRADAAFDGQRRGQRVAVRLVDDMRTVKMTDMREVEQFRSPAYNCID